MAEFKSLDAAMQEIKGRLAEALNTSIAEEVKEFEKSHVYSDVYEAYYVERHLPEHKPAIYERRYEHGGLADTRGMQHTIEYVGDDVVKLYVDNANQLNLKYGNAAEDLAGIVEFGHGNGYGSYIYPLPNDAIGDFYPPRPFIQNTREDLAKYKTAIVRDALRKQGLNVK